MTEETEKIAWSLVSEWAEKMWKVKIDNIKEMALYLLEKNMVDGRSHNAYALLNMDYYSG